ncbi:hypothetical protein DVH24_031636 [Malus domestica]|uniref:RNase H type-1 domain-containing protein n=1 Tax=Malus domestica TaxID=3750 RepID=A0A498J0N7_MALDO|nr:hypothetical protein DVH24_031636 [Malus domestica]
MGGWLEKAVQDSVDVEAFTSVEVEFNFGDLTRVPKKAHRSWRIVNCCMLSLPRQGGRGRQRHASWVGFGLIIRDDSGSFVTAMAGHFMDTFSPQQAEALAFRAAVLWAISRDFHPNGVAHRLARFGLTLNHDCTWGDSLPSLIMDAPIEDVPGHD